MAESDFKKAPGAALSSSRPSAASVSVGGAPGGQASGAEQKRRRFRALLTDPVPWLALVVVFAADQVSKAVVISDLALHESFPAAGFFRFTHAWNTGTAFGLFPQYGGLLTMVSLLAVVVLVFLYRSASNPSFVLRAAFGMQLGGAFGNLFDRVRLGHVTDFIDVGPWPVFNLADSAIVVGIALMAYYFWGGTREEPPVTAPSDGAAGAASSSPGVPPAASPPGSN